MITITIAIILLNSWTSAEPIRHFGQKAAVDIPAYRRAHLACLNKYRAIHQVGSLRETDQLTNMAQAWAQHLIDTGDFNHQGGVGENLYAYWHSADVPPTPEAPCESWYSEEKDYNYATGDPVALHFTQMVWKSSTDVGIGIANKDGRYVVVADFSPPGNYIGQFKENVFPPK